MENYKVRSAMLKGRTLQPRVAGLFNKWGNDNVLLKFTSDFRPESLPALKAEWAAGKGTKIVVLVDDGGQLVWVQPHDHLLAAVTAPRVGTAAADD